MSFVRGREILWREADVCNSGWSWTVGVKEPFDDKSCSLELTGS